MKRYRVLFGEGADQHLLAIWRYVAERSDPDAADRVVAEIRERCRSLQTYPDRGTPRGDLRVGLRTIPIPHRATIGYAVAGGAVVVVAIAYLGKDMALLVGDSP